MRYWIYESIAKELIGCRVYEQNDMSKKVIGKIVIFYTSSSYNIPQLGILTNKGNIVEFRITSITIIEEDLKKIYSAIKPEPIDNRFDILDL